MYWRITSTGVPATGTFISIDKFTKFCSQLRTEHYMHMINVMVYYTIDRTIEQVFFFIFAQFISHLKRKENSCYIMLNVVLTDMGWSMHKNRSWSNIVIFCKFFISCLSIYICIDFFIVIWDQCICSLFILFFLYSFDQFLFY